MKTKLLSSFALGCLILCTQLNAAPLGTAFTYQGRLSEGTNCANGLYDMAFSLYDDPSTGQLIGPLLITNAVPVSSGLFIVTLDFGTNAFFADARWLSIAVKTNGTTAFTRLSPRQPVTPAPNATYAIKAGVASYATNAISAFTSTTVAANGVTTAGLQDGSVTGVKVDAASFSNTFWKVDGNSGTTPGVHFMGTTDNQPLVLKVNNQPALRLEPDANCPNVVAGSSDNTVASGFYGAAIGGGSPHQVNANYGTISGGYENGIMTGSEYATVSGGSHNTIQRSQYAGIAGGQNGTIRSNSWWSAISGGEQNQIGTNANWAAIPGGRYNVAGGNASLAAGYRAQALHRGTFVWGDFQENVVASTGPNQFLIRAAGGVGIGTNNPQSALHVVGTVTAQALSGDGSGLTGLNGGSLASGTVSDSRLSPNVALRAGGNVFTGNQTVMSGNIGIGTASPQAKLDINGSARVQTLEGQPGQALEAFVGGKRALRLEPTADDASKSGMQNVIAGSPGNYIAGGVRGSVIAGGGATSYAGHDNTSNSISSDISCICGGLENSIEADSGSSFIGGGWGNRVEASYGTICGGDGNLVQGFRATIVGGSENRATGVSSFVGGGGWLGGQRKPNVASGDGATICGGGWNVATGWVATVGGGHINTAGGEGATVPGGTANAAVGDYSFAAGNQAKAHGAGSFVWGDSTPADVHAWGDNEFVVRATGGYWLFSAVDGTGNPTAGATLAAGSGTWGQVSDRNAKTNCAAVDPRAVLDKVAALPITTWNYKTQDPSIRHMGPMAQDFHSAFGVGESDKTITTIDSDGVALAAIQGLNQKLEEKNAALEKEVAELKALVKMLADKVNGGGQ